MTIKRILAPIRGDGKGEAVLGLAVAIGKLFNAHIDVVHVHAKPEDLYPFGVPLPSYLKDTIVEASGTMVKEEEKRLRSLFETYCQARELPEVPWDSDEGRADRLTISWREESGKQAEAVTLLGRLADLIVIARPDRVANLGMNTLEAALFELRKPTAIAPPQEVSEAGRHVAIAWNGSIEASRAVDKALPIMAKAGKVTILSTPGERPARLGVEELSRYLRAHDLTPELASFPSSRHDIGGPLLQAVHDCGADFLVMGAFGNQRRREFVLGGVTQYVMDHADLPMMMSH